MLEQEQTAKVKCPLCEGEGTLSPSTLVHRFTNPDLRQRLEARIAEIAENADLATNSAARNFFKEVHTWNPALPIWRRSPKE